MMRVVVILGALLIQGALCSVVSIHLQSAVVDFF